MRRRSEKVSVLLPVYNSEKYISESIDSILSQTYENYELLIINDGSTDKSKDIILSKKDRRIVYIENVRNQGIIKSLNKGLYYCKENLIARMDADDVACNNRLEFQTKFLNDRPHIDILGGAINIGGNILGHRQMSYQIRTLLLVTNPLFHPTIMMRKSRLNSLGIYYDKHAKDVEDYKLWIDASLNNLVLESSSNVVLNYRLHEEQISHVKRRDQIINSFSISLKYAKIFFPEILENKASIYFKLLTGNCNSEAELENVSSLCRNLINMNEKKNYFDREYFNWLFNTCKTNNERQFQRFRSDKSEERSTLSISQIGELPKDT